MSKNNLSIRNELEALDAKDRNFYDNLTEEERKKFSPYLMMRYSASVEGHPDMQTWHLMATNERVNKNFFDVSTTQHKKFQWLMCTTVSPGLGSQRHYWLGTKKSEKNNKAIKFLTELYPHLKSDDIELMAELNTQQDLKDLARQHGWDDKKIRSDL